MLNDTRIDTYKWIKYINDRQPDIHVNVLPEWRLTESIKQIDLIIRRASSVVRRQLLCERSIWRSLSAVGLNDVTNSWRPLICHEHSTTVKRHLTVLAHAFGDPSYKADGDDDENGSLVDAAATAPTVIIPARR